MGKNDRMKNIFADKASLVLRKMLQNPERKWVVRDFTGHEGISLGMSQEVLKAMEKKGYIERVKKGPNSYTILANKKKLISNWLEEYSFDQNIMDTYYSANKNILNKFRKVLKENQYALTLHTGANLITSFVRTEEIFIYMNLKDWKKDILDIRQNLDIILAEVVEYKKKGYFVGISKNIKKYFERKTSQGCLMIEKENGPDEYIDDLKQDIFERFNQLLEFL